MVDLSIEQVIKSLATNELIDAVETFLDHDGWGQSLWPLLDEIERRDPAFEI